MDRLFSTRKPRSTSNAEQPTTLRKQPSIGAIGEGSLSQKRQAVKDAFSEERLKGKRGNGRIGDKAPSLNIDIRNSLILPGLSEQFSVLLPSLSTAPESSIRSLLASQRARPDGPSLTEEEEDLLFAEIRNTLTYGYGEPQHLSRNESSQSFSRSANERYTPGTLSTSTSSPSIMSSADSDGPISAPFGSSTWATSPPPTSTSFSSFHTFGVSESNTGVKVKSYGFSGGSGFRDGEYIRKVKRSGNGKALDPTSSRTDGISADPDAPTNDPISPLDPDHSGTLESPTLSERTATPSSAQLPVLSSFLDHCEDQYADAPKSSPLPPRIQPPPTPDSSEFHHPEGRPQKKRQSLLAGLTPAQVKRISSALGEIEGKLSRSGFDVSGSGTRTPRQLEEDEEEETLQAPEPEDPVPASSQPREAQQSTPRHSRAPSGDAASVVESQPVVPASPSRLPPSPRSLNLRAQVEETTPSHSKKGSVSRDILRSDVPKPILTPSRTQPVRHQPSPSTSSHVSPPIYIPGQPRPVGSMHRSDGSVSSRSGTPVPASWTPPAVNRNRSDSNPSPIRQPIAPRTSSLARSLSASQGNDRKAQEAFAESKASSSRYHSPHSAEGHMDGRQATAVVSPTPTDVITEEEEPKDEESHPPSQTAAILEQHDTDNRLDHAQRLFRDNNPDDAAEIILHSASPQMNPHETAGQQSETSEFRQYLQSPSTIRKMESSSTMGSDFAAGFSFDTQWDAVLASPDSESPITPADETGAADMLRKLSGVGSEELSTLQTKLVEKAKQERIALRGELDSSPVLQMSPALTQATLPSRSPKIVQDHPFSSPPLTALHQVPSAAFASRSPPLPVSGAIPAPPEHALLKTPGVVPLIRRAAPPPPPPEQQPASVNDTPSDAHDELISTPTTSLDRKPSRRVAPEDDPNVRRDFEARIAAATAALNRTPSTSAGPLRRKNTKKGAPLAISSPTLVSSSTKLTGTPLGTPESIDPGMAKSLEKASGSASKMSMRWRKLGFRRGPSVSNSNEIHTPPPGGSAQSTPKLEEPIALRSPSPQLIQSAPLVPTSNSMTTSPDLNAFRFPSNESNSVMRSQSTKAEPTSGIRQMMGKIRRRTSDEKVQDKQATISQVAPQSTEVPIAQDQNTSDEQTITKFVEAGRALGLNDEQLGQMIEAKGIGRRTQPSAEMTAHQTEDTSRTSPNLASHETSAQPADKASNGAVKGLFRSLSRSKKNLKASAGRVEAGEPVEEPVPRNVVVRRTLLVPTEDHTPQASPQPPFSTSNGLDSPDSSNRHGAQRKLSVKRKPLNLTREDQALVQASPPPRARKVSATTTSSARSDGQAENVGLGFLQPPGLGHSTSSISDGEGDRVSVPRSSAGGSIYDLYHDTPDETEMLVSPSKSLRQASDYGRRSQAIEITEYADGKMIWSLVDGLRGEEEDDDDNLRSASPSHSRTASYESGRRDSGGDVFRSGSWKKPLGGTIGLNLRHRSRTGAARPPTDVYYTSSADVADLIDHLSHDLDSSKGRIDILPTIPAESPTSPTRISTVSDQFEDAPSPRKAPPTPIRLPPRGMGGPGFSPSRPGFAHKGLGSVRSDISPRADSFASSEASGVPGRTVEDRLQALLDRLKDSGVRAS